MEITNKRKLVYVCSPYRGNVEKNLDFAKFAMKCVIAAGEAPLAPHFQYPLILDDNDPKERALGLELDHVQLHKCDEVWVFVHAGISDGMAGEIDNANAAGIPVRRFDLTPVLNRSGTDIIPDDLFAYQTDPGVTGKSGVKHGSMPGCMGLH